MSKHKGKLIGYGFMGWFPYHKYIYDNGRIITVIFRFNFYNNDF